jgi:hypothetical protein
MYVCVLLVLSEFIFFIYIAIPLIPYSYGVEIFIFFFGSLHNR